MLASQQNELNEIVLMVAAQKPRDVTETMLCLQMIGVHVATTNALGTVRNSEHVELKLEAGNLAAKLSRTFALQMDTLQRYRTKGKAQKVAVTHKHYHVASGAQAVFGDVSAGGRGAEKTTDQPHVRGNAPRLAHSGELPMELIETPEVAPRKVA